MELVDVDMIGAQVFQTDLQVLPQLRPRPGVGLGGDDHLVPDPLEGIAHLLLAVGVRAGSVEVVHPAVHRLAQQTGGLLFRDPLDRQTAKAVLLDLDPSGA